MMLMESMTDNNEYVLFFLFKAYKLFLVSCSGARMKQNLKKIKQKTKQNKWLNVENSKVRRIKSCTQHNNFPSPLYFLFSQ